MTTPNCGTCEHWNLAQNLGQHGYGTCNVRPDHAMRAGLTTGPQSICRIGKFKKADAKVVRERERMGGTLL